MIIQMLYTSLVVVSDTLPLPPALEVIIPVVSEGRLTAAMLSDMPVDESTVMRCADSISQAFDYALDTLRTAGEPVEFVVYQ